MNILKPRDVGMSTFAKPTLIDKEQKDGADQIMSMNRKERRRIGKQLGVKIPGSTQPIYAHNQTEKTS